MDARLILEPFQALQRIVGGNTNFQSPLNKLELGDAMLGLDIGKGGHDALKFLEILSMSAENIGFQAGAADEGVDPFVSLIADAGRDDLLAILLVL